MCPGLPVDDKKKRTTRSDSANSARKHKANPGKKGKKRRRVAYPSPRNSSSDEEWIPGMSPDLTRNKRKQKGKETYYHGYCCAVATTHGCCFFVFFSPGAPKLPPLDIATRLEMLKQVDEEVVRKQSIHEDEHPCIELCLV